MYGFCSITHSLLTISTRISGEWTRIRYYGAQISILLQRREWQSFNLGSWIIDPQKDFMLRDNIRASFPNKRRRERRRKMSALCQSPSTGGARDMCYFNKNQWFVPLTGMLFSRHVTQTKCSEGYTSPRANCHIWQYYIYGHMGGRTKVSVEVSR